MGVALQAGKAARAAATAVSSWAREQSGASATTCSLAGFNTGKVEAPATPLPPMVRVKSLSKAMLMVRFPMRVLPSVRPSRVSDKA